LAKTEQDKATPSLKLMSQTHEREQLIYAIPEKSTSMSLDVTYRVPVPRNFTHGGENFFPPNKCDRKLVKHPCPESDTNYPLNSASNANKMYSGRLVVPAGTFFSYGNKLVRNANDGE